MKNLSRDGYTTKEIMDALRGAQGTRNIDYRYDLLDENDNKIDELYEVINGEVQMSAFSTIKRTATFSLREEEVLSEERIPKKLVSFVGTKIGGL